MGSPHFIDAMMAGLNELNEESTVNVLITLTDGQNNSSSITWREVVAEAQKKRCRCTSLAWVM